jgi:branched-chain amino acid transport system permease protein
MHGIVYALVTGSLIGLIYAVVALSFVFVYRASGVFNFAQGSLIVLGGYLVWWISESLKLGAWLGIALATGLAFLIGLGIERLVFRPLVAQPILSHVMATLGLLFVLQGIPLLIWGAHPREFPQVVVGPSVRVGSLILSRPLLVDGLIALALILLVWQFLERTTWGLRLTSVAESHFVAQSIGVSPEKAIALSWGVACVLATWSAVFLLDGRGLVFQIGEVGLRVLVLPLLSGLESVPGLILSGILIGATEQLAAAYLDPFTEGAASRVFPYVLMLVALLVRPEGLFGWRRIERV